MSVLTGYVLYQVEAIDIDGDPITYYTDSSSATLSLFGVNNETGDVFVTDSGTPLDRDVRHTLERECSDGGEDFHILHSVWGCCNSASVSISKNCRYSLTPFFI